MARGESVDILKRIRTGTIEREKVARELLLDDKLRSGISKVIVSKGGSKEDVRSVLHLTIISFFKKVLQDRTFILDTDKYRYLNGIAKYLWYAELRKKKDLPERQWNEATEGVDPGHELNIINDERRQMLHQVLEKLGPDCKQILLMWAGGYSMKEIMDEVGGSSEGSVRKKKFKCMKAVAKYLDEHPEARRKLKE